MDFAGRKVWVVGLGKSGLAAARVLASLGAVVTASDQKSVDIFDTGLKDELDSLGIKVIFEDSLSTAPEDIELAIISPGISLNKGAFAELEATDREIISEIELAYRICPNAKIIAITGTNGKTTTTTLIGDIFKEAGWNVFVVGNIGVPLIEKIIFNTEDTVYVTEVSSFQLETSVYFKPKVSVIINITPDHIDWHGSYENYVRAKEKILINQTEADYSVLNIDDANIVNMLDACKAKKILSTQSKRPEHSVFVHDGCISTNINGSIEDIISINDMLIKGKHNVENALHASGAALAMGVSISAINKTLSLFPGVEHRLEKVRSLRGVEYINDSKGTNVDAALKALEAYDDPIILIAGGKDKGNSFAEFAEKIKEKVKYVVLIGVAAEKIAEELRKIDYSHYHKAIDMQQAVYDCSQIAKSGDLVILSPACASFDMFDNFEHRGRVFKDAVYSLS